VNDYDLVGMQVAEPVFGEQAGMALLQTHAADKCAGREIPCCIHRPSAHRMVTWPMNWRGDTGVMERICPHGVGHPDPDHMAYVKSLTPEHDCPGDHGTWFDPRECEYPHLDWQGVHGCDGCCR